MGTNRRRPAVGLRHLAAKTNEGWTRFWVKEPKAFHPETRMPQFFNLTNQKDAHAEKLQPVEIAGIATYLFAKSEELKSEPWPEGYEADVERGKKLFSQRGCLACHAHDDFQGIKADFGPNLTHAHQKLKSKEWLYTWLREPTRHSARTKMPNLYLEPETVNGVKIDPAADITAYLLAKGPKDYELEALPGVYFGATFDPRFNDETAARLGLDSANGALVAFVMPGSAASRTFQLETRKAGDKSGVTRLEPLVINDVVVRYNGIEITDAAQLAELVSATQPGQAVPITVRRHGRTLDLRIDPDPVIGYDEPGAGPVGIGLHGD
jgi:cbb3-type cytochrome oxidase cytochrome c subunit